MRLHQHDPGAPVVVDLFAGFGGFSLGAERAGARVAFAANHWPLAVEGHAVNHPATKHQCQDLRQMDWRDLPDYDFLVAGPSCQGHSNASQPRRRRYHEGLRATAWAVVDCLDATEPRGFIVENVPQFLRWRLFPDWLAALERMGYTVDAPVLNAAAVGVPQLRRRVFITGTKRASTDRQPAPELPARPPAFGPHIDWQGGDWRPLAACRYRGARERMEAARAEHGPRCMVQHVTGHRGLPVSEPVRTITAADQWTLINGDRYRRFTTGETGAAMGLPHWFRWPASARRRDIIRGQANAVVPACGEWAIRRLMEAA